MGINFALTFSAQQTRVLKLGSFALEEKLGEKFDDFCFGFFLNISE